VLDSLFSFLFKYPRLVFEQGNFTFGATRSMALVAVIAAVAGLYALWTYRRLVLARGRERSVLLALRAAMLALVLFALLQPMLLLTVAVPQQNWVGILLDDSSSMRIEDHEGGPRSDFVLDQLGRPDAPLLTALGERFSLRIFRFSSAAERLMSAGDITFQGTSTRLGDAMTRARDEMSGLPVAGLVVVSDGADNAAAPIDDALAGMRAQAMPVFTVGVGREALTRDVQITRVELPRRVLKGTSLVVDVIVTQTGYAGQTVPLSVENAGIVVSTQDVTLPPNGESLTVRARFKASELGPHVFTFRIPGQDGEEVPQNNRRDMLTEVYDDRQKILYLEGEPRFEPKFIRQATAPDDNLQVVLLQRTAEATVDQPDKYLRLGVSTPDELANGFPSTREELFKYRAIILGSIEASAFRPDQQRMLEDFVDVRGGGLLALGGHRAFAEGGWGGTPLSNALPLAMDRGLRSPTDAVQLVVRPTPAGLAHPAAQIAEGEEENQARWRELPPLTSVNVLGAVKPGATVLLTGADERGADQVVLVYQRYGRGKALIMPVQDVWMWQMHASVPVEDQTHEIFWQRVSRWLVDGVPERVMVSAMPDQVERGDPIMISADVLDAEYRGVNDGRISASITTPSGAVEDVPLEWTVENDGEYRGRFTPLEDGIYRLSVGGVTRDDVDVGRGATAIRVAPSQAEYFDAAMRAPLLQRIAGETDGRFFRATDADQLPDAISYSGRGITVVEQRELWDMPIVLFLLLGLMGAEWVYRRGRGLA
jgi:uncharacterized membrane protein